MEALFKKERTKQRILIQLDETRMMMERSMQRLLERDVQLEKVEEETEQMIENSRRIYWASVPWYKRWLYCCFY